MTTNHTSGVPSCHIDIVKPSLILICESYITLHSLDNILDNEFMIMYPKLTLLLEKARLVRIKGTEDVSISFTVDTGEMVLVDLSEKFRYAAQNLTLQDPDNFEKPKIVSGVQLPEYLAVQSS